MDSVETVDKKRFAEGGEPDAKRVKVTETPEESATPATGTDDAKKSTREYQKRKIVLLFGYLGSAYQGLQR